MKKRLARLFKNRLIIIDEVHNIVSETGTFYSTFKDAIDSAPDSFRIVIMSATPIFDKPAELGLTINLLRPSTEFPVGKEFDKKFIKSAHDVSLGGIITALSKMCIKGKKGATLKKSNYLINQFEYLFGEDQGRYIIEISKDDLENATKILQENSVHFDELGLVNEDSLIIDDKTKVSIDDLIKSHTNWLTNYMEN